jgi:hypothetical protein
MSKCKGITKAGNGCKRYAMHSEKFCYSHKGKHAQKKDLMARKEIAKPRWVVIHSEQPETIAVGIYSTKKKAEIAYIDFLNADSKRKKLLKNAMAQLADDFPGMRGVDPKKLHSAAFQLRISQDVDDAFNDLISHSIERVDWELVNNFEFFNDWNDWNTESLMKLQTALREGEMGDTWV